MNAINSAQLSSAEIVEPTSVKVRRSAIGSAPGIFPDIYEKETNIVVWQRQLAQTLKNDVADFLQSNPSFQTSMTVTPQSAVSSLAIPFYDAQLELRENIAELVDMFCYLFELKRVGLRLTALDRAMCPKFHVDRVPCRLVTTFQGVATEWLPHQTVNRSKLGHGSNGMADHQSGLYQRQADIQQLHCGDVGLLKGESWEGNENAGLVHRSPALPAGERRLLLTLDFSH